MFDPINGPPDHYSGPSAGLSTEKGDSWHTAVAKINAGFEKVKEAIEGAFSHAAEAIDADARKEIADLRETVAALQMKLDGMPATSADPAAKPDPAQPDPAGPPADAAPSTEAQPQS